MIDQARPVPTRAGTTPVRLARWTGAAVFLVVVLLSAAGSPAVQAEPGAQPALTPALAERGKVLYAKQCLPCHGATGRGDGKAAYLLYPKPRDFASLRFRLVSTENKIPSDADLFASITRGLPGSGMPSWAQLSEEDRWSLVYEVRRLARVGKAQTLVAEDGTEQAQADALAEKLFTAGAAIQVPAETPSGTDLERGKALFEQACASCHDQDGKGRRKRDLKDDLEYPLFARDFTQGIFKGGSTGKDLAARLICGIPGTPMPSFKDTLKDPADLWAVIHYVQGFIAQGAQERVEQRQKSIEAVRVVDEGIGDPISPAWLKAKPTWVSLMPLWWRDERVEGVEVRVLQNATKVAFMLTWRDVTKNDLALLQTAFGDGAAVQFSPSVEPPFFAMGEKTQPVNIWSWKAAWESDMPAYQDVQNAHPNIIVDWYDSMQNPPRGRHTPVSEFPTNQHDPTYLTGWGAGNVVSHPVRASSVEDLNAAGFGTLTNQGRGAQSVTGKARWSDGTWQVVFVRDIAASEAGDILFRAGQTMSVGFAVWDGAAGDRNGQKSVTIWHNLKLAE